MRGVLRSLSVTVVLVLLATRAISAEIVAVRGGLHPQHGRIVFDWPEPTGFVAEIVDDHLLVTFEQTAHFDTRNVEAQLSRYVSAPTITEAGNRLVFPLRQRVGLRSFQLGERVVLDLLDEPPAEPEELASTRDTLPSNQQPTPLSELPVIRVVAERPADTVSPGVITPVRSTWEFEPGQQSLAQAPPVQPTPDAPSGFFVGFEIDGSVETGIGYTDNVFFTRNDKTGDGIWRVAPRVELSRDGEDLDLKFYGDAEIGRYFSEDRENYEDFRLGTDFGYSVGAATSEDRDEIFGGLSFAREHEGRDSPDDINGREPTVYHNLLSYLGYAFNMEEWGARLGATFQRLNFDDVDGFGGTEINNDDRDRDLYTLGLRVGKEVSRGWEVFGQGFGDWRDYDQKTDDFGLERSSRGVAVAGGVRYQPGPALDLEVLLGLLHQDYDESTFDSTTTPDVGFLMNWRPSRSTRVLAGLDRSIEETTDPSASGIVATSANLNLAKRIRPDLSLVAGVDYTFDDYEGSGREDQYWGADAGLRHYFLPNLYIGPSYRFEARDSNEPDFDFDNHQILLNLGAKLNEAYDAEATEFNEPNLDGAYIGTQFSTGSLNSEVEGSRGRGGSLTADFSDNVSGLGLFGGYGMSIDSWYLGLEADAEKNQGGWDHARLPGGRIFGVEKDWSAGIGPLFGYRLQSGPLLYGRFGVQATRFETEYVASDGTESDRKDTQWGLAFGGGTEMPVDENLFLRMDYRYASYPDYDAGSDGGGDNFANSESTLRVGLGYRFGAPEELPPPSPPVDLEGFYAGAQGGIGTLFSEVRGPRNNDSRLQADFGDEGLVGGVFGGYGTTFDKFYLGLDLEAEVAGQRSDNVERDPPGRVISVRKDNTVGAGVRVGYQLGAAGMVYARAGSVWTRFTTDYKSRTDDVTERNREQGWRLGGGLEIPLEEKVFLRLDYSYTWYDSYDVTYDDTNTDSFDVAENLFRVGLGWRF